MNGFPIPTFIVNLKHRTDRKEHVLNEFSGRDEFNVTVVEPQKDESAPLSLWKTIIYIIENMVNKDDEFFLLCEDDHQFSDYYKKDKLMEYIQQANEMNIDILSGGASTLYNFVQVYPNLFWMDIFCGLQFTIIFKRFYQSITTSTFEKGEVADLKISAMTNQKFLIYPFISTQKEFGYSDVTKANNSAGRVDRFFEVTRDKIKIALDVSAFYQSQEIDVNSGFDINDYQNVNIPTYIINLPERKDRLNNIKKQFAGKDEFDITIVEAIKNPKGSLGLWLTIREIIETAMEDDHDIIVICEDDHEFTSDYSKTKFLKNAIEAHIHGAGILLGGIGSYGFAALVNNDLFWVNGFFCTQFTVIYKSLFKTILEESFDDTVTADGIFSQITSNKMVMYPFISVQKDFGYSDVTKSNNNNDRHIERLFENTNKRLKKNYEAKDHYLNLKSNNYKSKA